MMNGFAKKKTKPKIKNAENPEQPACFQHSIYSESTPSSKQFEKISWKIEI